MSDCPLCIRELKTTFYYESEKIWVVNCQTCKVPMIVWKIHEQQPPEEEIAQMRFWAEQHFPGRNYDDGMRQIPDHYHAHLR